MKELEAPDAYITIARAAELSGLSAYTLRRQAQPRAGKPPRLRTTLLGPRIAVTTRQWLHEYLMSRDEVRQQAVPLPEGYQAPE